MSEAAPDKIRLAIVGGGCAGLSAAWELSRQPGYDIHLFEKSWHLGGKGASVRSRDGRILEHGLHVWFGFYENAFKMMRECYAEVERRNWGPSQKNVLKLTHGRIEDAFYPEPNLGVADPALHGEWAFWSALLPPADGLPGTPIDERSNPYTLANYLLRCFSLLKTLILSAIGPANETESSEPGFDMLTRPDAAVDHKSNGNGATPIVLLIDRMTDLLRVGSLTSAAVLLQAVTILETWLRSLHHTQKDRTPKAADAACRLIEALAAQLRKLLRDLTMVDSKVRTRTEVIDIVMTIAVGLFRDRVLFDDRGLDAINHLDYREWLRKHGATDEAIRSRFLVGTYDLVFAYRDGDRTEPALAAGVAVRGALRMFFTYRGSMVWRMASGMGDAVFAPLYRVLQAGRQLDSRAASTGDGETSTDSPKFASPVTFHFGHELREIDFSVSDSQKRYLTTLKFATHGESRDLDEQSVDALDVFGCWPESPNTRFTSWNTTPAHSERILHADMHRIILAMGIDDLKHVVADRLPEVKSRGSTSPSRWKKMFDEVKTVGTKSAQVWLRRDLKGLGWDRGSGLLTALGLSFSTWADMTLTLPAERAWRSSIKSAHEEARTESPLDKARSVAYFCDVLPDAAIARLDKDARSPAMKTLADKLRDLAGRLRSADPRLVGTDNDPRRVAIDAILKLAIPRMLHGAIDVKLTALLGDIAKLGRDARSDEIVSYIAAAAASFERDVFEAGMTESVNRDLDVLLAQELRPIWPLAYVLGHTPVDLENSRYSQVNFKGSDRYTQSLPSTPAHRISPLDRSVENTTVAGDWTACGLDVGCVEAAIMSGMLAAYAISGEPSPRSILGYDHP